MCGAVRDTYGKEVSDLVYKDYRTPTQLDDRIAMLLVNYNMYPNAIKYIINIRDVKEKLCKTY